MYITIKEAAELLSISEANVTKLILQNRIRAIHDGKQFLLNQEQFNTHFEQLEKYKLLMEELNNEPIPEDIDVKDED